MQTTRTGVWSALERRSADAFLVAGVLLLASPAHIILERFMNVPLPSWLVASVILPGLLLILVGVAGLYPRIADRAPRLAYLGGLFTILAGTTLVVLLGWILGDRILATSSGIAIGSPPDLVFLIVSTSMTLAFVLFGTASLRVGVPSRRVGGLLLSFTSPWLVSLAATTVYGAAFPRWLTLIIYGPIPLVIFSTGYTLRRESAPTAREASSFDPALG